MNEHINASAECQDVTIFAGEQGFEPRSATLKAAVLPLNHSLSIVGCFDPRERCDYSFNVSLLLSLYRLLINIGTELLIRNIGLC